jgi:hypothetical protein
MKREKVFSEGGYYSFIIQSNCLMHDESIALGTITVGKWLQKYSGKRSCKLLDLACGGIPISTIEIMESFPEIDFRYTGIDINPDQVNHAQTAVDFPANVSSVNIIEGNAWDVGGMSEKFDIIFSGLNFHHGIVDELYSVACQIDTILNQGGFVFSHDEFRPDDAQYIERPAVNPEPPFESFRLIEKAGLEFVPELNIPSIGFNKDKDDWRSRFIRMLSDYLWDHDVKKEYIKQARDHIFSRDFPVSVSEIKRIFKAVNFEPTELMPDTEHELAEYFRFLVFERRS